MRIIAPSENVVDAGEGDRQFESPPVKIHSVIVEALQVIAWRPLNVRPALAECFESAVEPFGKIRNGAAEMA